jgi:hypothetical protein
VVGSDGRSWTGKVASLMIPQPTTKYHDVQRRRHPAPAFAALRNGYPTWETGGGQDHHCCSQYWERGRLVYVRTVLKQDHAARLRSST